MRRTIVVVLMMLTLCAVSVSSALAAPGVQAQRCNARNYTIAFWPAGHPAVRSSRIPKTSLPSGALFVGPSHGHPKPQLLLWFAHLGGSGTGSKPTGISCSGSPLPANVTTPITPKWSSEPGTLKCSFSVPPLTTTKVDTKDGFETSFTFTMIADEASAVVMSLTDTTSTVTYEPRMCRFTKTVFH